MGLQDTLAYLNRHTRESPKLTPTQISLRYQDANFRDLTLCLTNEQQVIWPRDSHEINRHVYEGAERINPTQ